MFGMGLQVRGGFWESVRKFCFVKRTTKDKDLRGGKSACFLAGKSDASGIQYVLRGVCPIIPCGLGSPALMEEKGTVLHPSCNLSHPEAMAGPLGENEGPGLALPRLWAPPSGCRD